VETYRRDIQPTHAPPVLFDPRGRGYVEQGPLTAIGRCTFLTLMANGAVIDVAASRDRARAQLGVRGSSSVAPAIGSHDLARRLFEYFNSIHIVEQLHLNVFNPVTRR